MAEFIEKVRSAHGLPSICAGAIVAGKIVSLDAVGVRKMGSNERVRADDAYHCGSITKSFTAALFATFVQEGKVTWSTPIGSIFPEHADSMAPGCAGLTPLHFLAQRSGLGGESWPKDVSDAVADWSGRPPSPRGEFVRCLLSAPLDHAPEGKFQYTNANYVVLGAILERLTGKTWEDLLESRILKPLRLRSSGFGPVPSPGPWGHHIEAGKLKPVSPGPQADNPPTLGPSASLHMSVPDLLRWCAFQADEGSRRGPLKPSTFNVLHTPAFGGSYAGGLVALSRDWGGGTVFYHNGSNTMNYEVLWIAPKKRFGVVVASNAYTPDVDAAVDEVAAELIKRYGPK